MTEADWPRVAEIWAEGIATGIATFETEPPDVGVVRRLAAAAGTARRGARPHRRRLGRALTGLEPALLRRCGREQRLRRLVRAWAGVGTALMQALVEAATEAGIWTIQTSVFPENTSSLALHERAGFRVVGRRERIAQLDGVWRDTLFLELRLP